MYIGEKNLCRSARESFREYLKHLGYSAGSLQNLPEHVKEFEEWMRAHEITDLIEVTPQHIQDYYEYLNTRPNKRRGGALSSITIGHHVYGLRLFFGWLEAAELITSNPISGLSFPAPEYPPREILSLEEVKALYEASETLRDKAILSVFYGCGLRRNEGIKLKVSDVHLNTHLLYVREGKGGRSRAVPMSGEVRKDLAAYLYEERSYWLKARLPSGMENTGYLLLNKHGKKISGFSLLQRLKYLACQAGIEKPVCLHQLRHSVATHLLERGVKLSYVRTFLGHKHLDTTQHYTRVNRIRL